MIIKALVILLIALIAILIYIFASAPKLPSETDAIIDGVINSQLLEVIVGNTGFASSGRLKIWYESISSEVSPKGIVVLNMAMAGNALDWPPKFVQEFVNAGYQVIRYDQRGTGMSDWVTDWDSKKPYSVADMAGDVVAVLDALEIQKAHVVGLSMGGMIAQEVAIQCLDRVASLTLLMTSGYAGDS
jgi:pimeloyl-ACP methyl ester carboxylesterase